ncbi:hypothetical protein CEP52_014923 [Fusarium oligoseptatum]|uniref:Uncharacterized protein n=1 Tax=Fusarium oligoseptatum TaxID=2604345 RepID=A0A428SHW8_9HYPO|nr:hypothetical protein CEP52_014923 [Fusarium oligoseptatum]
MSETLYSLAKQTTSSTLNTPSMNTLIAMSLLAVYEIGQPNAALNALTTLSSALALMGAFQLDRMDQPNFFLHLSVVIQTQELGCRGGASPGGLDDRLPGAVGSSYHGAGFRNFDPAGYSDAVPDKMLNHVASIQSSTMMFGTPLTTFDPETPDKPPLPPRQPTPALMPGEDTNMPSGSGNVRDQMADHTGLLRGLDENFAMDDLVVPDCHALDDSVFGSIVQWSIASWGPDKAIELMDL